jgi:hypothetical protein
MYNILVEEGRSVMGCFITVAPMQFEQSKETPSQRMRRKLGYAQR